MRFADLKRREQKERGKEVSCAERKRGEDGDREKRLIAKDEDGRKKKKRRKEREKVEKYKNKMRKRQKFGNIIK
jgi:hypothetical protein